MNKLSAAMAACVFVTGMATPSQGQAMRMDGFGTTICYTSTVTSEGGSLNHDVCYVHYTSTVESDFYFEFDGAYLTYGGGRTQIGTMTVRDGLRVSLDGKKVYSDDLECRSSEDVQRAAEVQFAVAQVKPLAPSGSRATLYMGNGDTQEYWKGSGAMQGQ